MDAPGACCDGILQKRVVELARAGIPGLVVDLSQQEGLRKRHVLRGGGGIGAAVVPAPGFCGCHGHNDIEKNVERLLPVVALHHLSRFNEAPKRNVDAGNCDVAGLGDVLVGNGPLDALDPGDVGIRAFPLALESVREPRHSIGLDQIDVDVHGVDPARLAGLFQDFDCSRGFLQSSASLAYVEQGARPSHVEAPDLGAILRLASIGGDQRRRAVLELLVGSGFVVGFAHAQQNPAVTRAVGKLALVQLDHLGVRTGLAHPPEARPQRRSAGERHRQDQWGQPAPAEGGI
jgi:hypothetical protein